MLKTAKTPATSSSYPTSPSPKSLRSARLRARTESWSPTKPSYQASRHCVTWISVIWTRTKSQSWSSPSLATPLPSRAMKPCRNSRPRGRQIALPWARWHSRHWIPCSNISRTSTIPRATRISYQILSLESTAPTTSSWIIYSRGPSQTTRTLWKPTMTW